MTEYKLSNVQKFDQISVRLVDDDILRGVVRSYLYKDSDDKGVYVYAFLSENGLRDFEDALDETGDSIISDKHEDLVERHTCAYFFPWSQVVYLQLN